MAISVVIPLYNKGPHIERTLQSVLSQTSLPDEIIVVDDGSTDGGGVIVKSLDSPRLRLIRQENRGVSAARNRGIAEASGELIAFLDADDAWKNDYLEEILYLRKHFPQAGAYGTAYEKVTAEGFVEKHPDVNILGHGRNKGLILNYFKVALYWPIWTSTTVIPKNILLEVGGFEQGEALTEDLDVWFKIALRYPIAYSNRSLAIYYQNATNRTIGFKRFTGEPVISRTIRETIESDRVSLNNLNDLLEYAAYYQLGAARDCLALGKKAMALQLLDYAKGTKKFAREWWKWRLIAALPGTPGPWLLKVKHAMGRRN
jgi:glycosyltransferase involved in cell wall biosynthesis